jgi:hypothetical protein
MRYFMTQSAKVECKKEKKISIVVVAKHFVYMLFNVESIGDTHISRKTTRMHVSINAPVVR